MHIYDITYIIYIYEYKGNAFIYINTFRYLWNWDVFYIGERFKDCLRKEWEPWLWYENLKFLSTTSIMHQLVQKCTSIKNV